MPCFASHVATPDPELVPFWSRACLAWMSGRHVGVARPALIVLELDGIGSRLLDEYRIPLYLQWHLSLRCALSRPIPPLSVDEPKPGLGCARYPIPRLLRQRLPWGHIGKPSATFCRRRARRGCAYPRRSCIGPILVDGDAEVVRANRPLSRRQRRRLLRCPAGD